MPIVIALVLLIPTYGLSLVGLGIYYYLKKSNLENAILYTLENPTAIGYKFENIDWSMALAFLEGKNAKLLYKEHRLIDCTLYINDKHLQVTIVKDLYSDACIIGPVEEVS